MFKKITALVISLMLVTGIGNVANAAQLDLASRLSDAKMDGISVSTDNQTLANQVYQIIADATSQDTASAALSDHDLAVFKFYYYPATVKTVTGESQPIAAKVTPMLVGLAATPTCFTQPSTNNVLSKAGTLIVQVWLNGKWCTSGGSIVSSTISTSGYVMGGTVGWKYISGPSNSSAYTASQAKMLTSVNLELNIVYSISQYTFCTKLYGNLSGGSSTSQSCTL